MKKDYFVSKMFYKMLIPSVLSSVGYAFSDMADALVVGQRMGETGLAAISLCLPIYMLMNVIMYAFGMGGAVRFSALLGVGNEKEAKNCFNNIFKVSLLSGVVFALLANLFAPQILTALGAKAAGDDVYKACETYMRIISAGAPLLILNIVFSFFLRNDNNEVLAARGFIIGNITDLSLNVILVLVFDLGTAGAAASTVIGSAVAIACYMPAIVGKKRNVIGISRSELDFRQTSSCFGVGFSTSVQHLFQLVFLLVVNRVMLTLGGEVYVAVFDVVYNISFLLVYLCEGTAEAAQPLVSTFAGEQCEEDCLQVKKLSVACSVLLSGTASVLICIFAGYIAQVFGISDEILPTAAYAMRIYCTGTVFIALNIVISRYCQSREDGKSAFVGVLLKNLLVAVPCVIFFSTLGSRWIWIAFPVSEAVSLVFFLLYYGISQKKKTQFDQSRICRVTLSGNDAEISALLDRCGEFCDKWQAQPSQKYYVTLVIEEIVASIVRNALGHSPDGKIRITLISEPNGDFTLHILDNAIEYNPLSMRVRGKTNRTDFDIDEVSVLLIKKKTKKYLYRQFTGFNSLTVRI